jgi:hypothetical protein
MAAIAISNSAHLPLVCLHSVGLVWQQSPNSSPACLIKYSKKNVNNAGGRALAENVKIGR